MPRIFHEPHWPKQPRQETPFGTDDLQNARDHAIAWLDCLEIFKSIAGQWENSCELHRIESLSVNEWISKIGARCHPMEVFQNVPDGDEFATIVKSHVHLIENLQSTIHLCQNQFTEFDRHWMRASQANAGGCVTEAGIDQTSYHMVIMTLAELFVGYVHWHVKSKEASSGGKPPEFAKFFGHVVPAEIIEKHWREVLCVAYSTMIGDYDFTFPDYNRIRASIEREHAYALTTVKRNESKLGDSHEVSGAAASSPGKGRRGRPSADPELVKREAQLAEDWERARASGTYKADFAKDHDMKLAQFDTLLSRVRKRKERADKKRD